MTNIKSKLISTTIIMAFAATPAFADHHAGDKMKKAEKMMEKGEAAMDKGSAMVKSGDPMAATATSMTADQRMKAETDIINAMSPEDKASYMTLSPKEQKMMMSQKLSGGDYMPGKAPSMPSASMPSASMPATSMSSSQDVIIMNADETGGMMSSDTSMQSTAAPMSAPAMPAIACPAGSKAQPDGTCMMTGDSDVMFNTSTGSMSSSATIGTQMSAQPMTTQTSMQSSGRFTTEGKPYMGTLDPATAFGNR